MYNAPEIPKGAFSLDPRIRYRAEFGKIKDEPEYNRGRAEERLLLLKEFLGEFEKSEIKRNGDEFSRRKVIVEFCAMKGIRLTTFSRWLQNFQAKGIKGLLPGYGNRKDSSPYTKTILPIVAEIIEPGESIAATYRRLLPVCEQRGIKAPSQKTLGRMLKTAGLSCVKGKAKKVTVQTILDIDLSAPLSCIKQLSAFISDSELITPAVKKVSLRQLRSLQITFSREKPVTLSSPLTDDEIIELKRYKAGLHKNRSAKASALLMLNTGAPFSEVVMGAGRHPSTIYEWVRKFKEQRLGFIEVKLHHPERRHRIEQRTAQIIDILHTPPSAYDVNRASWDYGSIAKVYSEVHGETISKITVQRVVKANGYTWRRARKVLTSPDPDYKEKIAKVLATLRGIKPNEAFFFIDEAGPYRVKKYGGKALQPPGAKLTLPERQKSKGSMQLIAALEALTNQLTWRFIEGKGTPYIIELLEAVRSEYGDKSTLYLTWDAISSHSSSILQEKIRQFNEEAENGMVPHVEVVPLPSRAQFLNIIEAVFSGMKRAVIANSNYATKNEMERAIARHFKERNQYYKDNPKRAGNKIWDKEAFDLGKLAGGLFRRM